jgi:hypothetical protein
MKKRMSENTHNTENTYAASHKNYRPKSDAMSSENWFADHKKLMWGIGSAVALGAGAFIYFKNKNSSDKYSDAYDKMNALEQNSMNDVGEEDVLVTTITEVEESI